MISVSTLKERLARARDFGYGNRVHGSRILLLCISITLVALSFLSISSVHSQKLSYLRFFEVKTSDKFFVEVGYYGLCARKFWPMSEPHSFTGRQACLATSGLNAYEVTERWGQRLRLSHDKYADLLPYFTMALDFQSQLAIPRNLLAAGLVVWALSATFTIALLFLSKYQGLFKVSRAFTKHFAPIAALLVFASACTAHAIALAAPKMHYDGVKSIQLGKSIFWVHYAVAALAFVYVWVNAYVVKYAAKEAEGYFRVGTDDPLERGEHMREGRASEE